MKDVSLRVLLSGRCGSAHRHRQYSKSPQPLGYVAGYEKRKIILVSIGYGRHHPSVSTHEALTPRSLGRR